MKILFGKSQVQSLSIFILKYFFISFPIYSIYLFQCQLHAYIYIHIYNNNYFPITISIDYFYILLKMAGIHRINSIKIIFRSNII